MTFEIHFDGACDNQRDRLVGTGFVVYGPDGREWYSEANGHIKGTNNVAEYKALIEVLEWCGRTIIDRPKAHFIIRGDSMLVVKQINRQFACNSQELKGLLRRCFNLLTAIPKAQVTIEWVPRELNTRADELSKQGLSLARKTK